MAAYDGLRQQVEELALRLVLTGPESSGARIVETWSRALQTLQEEAVREGASALAEAARGVLRAMQISDPASALQDGIARLQQALETRAADPAETSLAQDPELLADFVLESREHLASLESQLLVLERDPCDSEALNAIFRSFHTIKGLAGFLGFREIQVVAHEVETVLDQARNLKFQVTPAAIDVILSSADYLGRWLNYLSPAGQNAEMHAPSLDPELLAQIGLIPSLAERAGRIEAKQAPDSQRNELANLAAAVETVEIEELTPSPEERKAEVKRRGETMTVKVNTAKLDYLVDMAGELVIAETLVRHDPELVKVKNARLQRNLAQLTRITAELQKTAMAMRLVSIGPLFRKMTRLVRDLSRQFGKPIDIQTEGDEIELDRNIVEELADPLMHMVRNAVDHGIEPLELRKSLGKPGTAKVLLKAQHQAGQVVIELSDDGRGLDRHKILARGLEKGLVAAGSVLSDSQIDELIFKPGFSTAAQITNVSGRGVGLDVVRRHIEKLRGRIEIRSQTGQGTTFLLKLPLTLAIIDGLVVGVGSERYIVPLFAVRGIFRPKEETIWTVQQRAEMALIRGSLVPVIRLYQRFGVPPHSEDPQKGVLILAEVESQKFCLLVDEVIGKHEVVIKSLGETFAKVAGIAGGAILGDGRVGLILDLDKLFRDKGNGARR